MQEVKQPFTNLQLELLRLFARNVPEIDLIYIKKLISQYFAEKAMDAADKSCEEKGITQENFNKISQEHYRIKY